MRGHPRAYDGIVMSPPSPEVERIESVPLFPLPNVVLLPRAVLPLHIFEERYRRMTADVLEGDRRIAMALLRPGWHANYHARPEIEPVVCVGQILSHERLSDGRYNFLLQGVCRARILREVESRPYRRADLEVIRRANAYEIDLDPFRAKLAELFARPHVAATAPGRQACKLLASPACTADIVDVLAFQWIEDVRARQDLLSEPDAIAVARRACAEIQRALSRTIPQVDPEIARMN